MLSATIKLAVMHYMVCRLHAGGLAAGITISIQYFVKEHFARQRTTVAALMLCIKCMTIIAKSDDHYDMVTILAKVVSCCSR